jgi:hypothetical protein
MADADRRRRFSEWFAGPPLRGDRAKLMQQAEISKGRVTQLLDPGEAFGELTARRLARKLGLREDYFTASEDEWPFQTIPRERFEGLTERQKGMIEQAMKNALRDVEAGPEDRRPDFGTEAGESQIGGLDEIKHRRRK